MILSIDIINAIQAKVDTYGDRGGITLLAQETGIVKPNITRWLQHDPLTKRKIITDNLWDKLYPAIKDFLPDADTQKAKKENIVFNDYKTNGKLPNYLANIVNGQINVYGVPNEKIIDALENSGLPREKIIELKDKIFS